MRAPRPSTSPSGPVLAAVAAVGATALTACTPAPEPIVVPAPTRTVSESGTLTVCESGCDHETITGAVEAAEAGETVLVSPGEYVGAVTLDKGVHLLAESYDEEDPRENTAVIDGDGAPAVVTIPEGVTPEPRITGFVIRGGEDDGIYPASPFTVENSYLTDAGDLIDYEEGAGGTARSNVFSGAGDDALDLDSPNVPLLVEGNTILDSFQDGIEIRLQDDEIAEQAVITIRDNEIRDSGQDGIQIIDYDEDTNRRFVIAGNLIEGSGEAAIGLMDETQTQEDLRAAPVREPIDVVGNTLVDNHAGISGGANLIAVNNIITGSSEFAFKGLRGDSRAAHNLLWDNDVDAVDSDGAVDDATTVEADPQLSQDYEPRPGSPAEGAGVDSFSWNGRTVVEPGATTAGATPGVAPDLGW